MRLKDVHVGMYGAVMGLAGLGLTARVAATVWPGIVRAPAYVTEPWVLLGAIALALLVPLYLVKLVANAAAVKADFTNPMLMGFCGALPVGMSLVAGGLGPYAPAFATGLWWTAFGLLGAFQVWALVRLLSGGIELGQVNAGWLIILVGGIVLPGPGLSLGLVEASRFTFGVSAAAAPILITLLLYRAIAGPPLPEALRPSWFILLVPPSLIYANGIALYPGLGILEALFPAALVLAVALFAVSRGFPRWPFGPPWWAFTFPLDALAYAAARYAQDHPEPLWRGVCAATLLLAAFFVLLVLWRTLRSAASRAG
jgi:tellurite resistance protein